MPNYRCASIWVDDANKLLYLGFSGQNSNFGDGAYTPVGLWSFSPDGTGSGTWSNLNSTADRAFLTQARPHRGLAASGNGKGYYLGGTARLLWPSAELFRFTYMGLDGVGATQPHRLPGEQIGRA